MAAASSSGVAPTGVFMIPKKRSSSASGGGRVNRLIPKSRTKGKAASRKNCAASRPLGLAPAKETPGAVEQPGLEIEPAGSDQRTRRVGRVPAHRRIEEEGNPAGGRSLCRPGPDQEGRVGPQRRHFLDPEGQDKNHHRAEHNAPPHGDPGQAAPKENQQNRRAKREIDREDKLHHRQGPAHGERGRHAAGEGRPHGKAARARTAPASLEAGTNEG